MRSGDTRAQLTNSLSASLRDGRGFGMQNSFGPRNAAMFCISTKTAPCAKVDQITRGGGTEIRFRGGVCRTRCEQYQRRSNGPSLQCHDCPSPLMVAKTIAEQLNDDKAIITNRVRELRMNRMLNRARSPRRAR